MEKKKRSVFLVIVLVLMMVLSPAAVVYSQGEENDSPAYQQAVSLMRGMSPEEKVGQLFLLTFDGINAGEGSEIRQLITEYFIGGVVLKQSNANIPADADQKNLKALTEELQTLALSTESIQDDENQLNDARKNPIPLFIGVSQTGGSFPYDQIFSSVTALPSQMAVGATWDRTTAISVGELMGNELESFGINLLIGPSLDIQDYIYSETEKTLGVRTFGGDPYWVSEMGAAYINGLHHGSGNRLAVIAGFFPGSGSTDRIPDVEVSTVRKSLEQLKLIELAPFFKVTNWEITSAPSITDGLLTSHIRYQGLQGNIRATTKPISFDQNAMNLLLDLEPIQNWRKSGGILVSDDLGSDAVEKFFNPEGQFIDARQVVKNAFLAGNDVLYIDQLQSSGDANRFITYKATIDLFIQKYKEDAAFAERIDESVTRILTLKYEIYNDFSLERIIPDASIYPIPLTIGDIPLQIAQQSATLINPSQNQLNEFIPNPPQFRERIIIFTDSETIVPCEGCEAVEVFPITGLQQSIINFYGPEGSGQVNPNHVVSYSFSELDDFTRNPINRLEIEENLSEAKWVLFAVREISPDRPESFALHNFITTNPVKLRDKNVVVFTFDSPNNFDATEISSFSAYYGLYSKTPDFIDVAARILFQEFSPRGSSPVSVPGIGYDLIEQMTPDPSQIIPLSVDEEAIEIPEVDEDGQTEINSDDPNFKLGDTIPVITGEVLDHNGNKVPDGTLAIFEMSEQGDGISIQQVQSETTNGIARAEFSLIKPGVHEIRVSSELAKNSEILVLDITEEEATVSAFIPTPLPVQSETPEVEELPEAVQLDETQPNRKFGEWVIATLLAWVFGIGSFFILRDYFTFENGLTISSMGVVGGLFVTVWMMFDFPGVMPRYGMNGFVRLGMVVLFGVMIGAIFGWLMLRIRKQIVLYK